MSKIHIMEDQIKILLAGIKKCSKILGYKQSDIADIIGTTQGTISRYYRGETRPKFEDIDLIIRELSIRHPNEIDRNIVLEMGRKEAGPKELDTKNLLNIDKTDTRKYLEYAMEIILGRADIKPDKKEDILKDFGPDKDPVTIKKIEDGLSAYLDEQPQVDSIPISFKDKHHEKHILEIEGFTDHKLPLEINQILVKIQKLKPDRLEKIKEMMLLELKDVEKDDRQSNQHLVQGHKTGTTDLGS